MISFLLFNISKVGNQNIFLYAFFYPKMKVEVNGRYFSPFLNIKIVLCLHYDKLTLLLWN